MTGGRLSFTMLLTLALALAGCVDAPDVPEDAADMGGGDGPASGDDGSADGDEETTWNAFAYGEPVMSQGEEIGTISGYTYDIRKEDWSTWSGPGAEADNITYVQEWTTEASYVGEAREEVRALKRTYDQETYESEEEVVSTMMDVHHLEHHIEVHRDDRENAAAGDTANVTLYLSPEALEAGFMAQWYFVLIAHEGNGTAGTWESGINETMREEQRVGEMMYAPYQEGDNPMDWWGFDDFTLLYGLSMFQPIVEGAAAFEEEGARIPGFNVEPTSFEVSGHTFDGYEITSDTGDGYMSLTLSPDLPIPYRLASEREQDGGGTDRQEYQLTALDIT